MSFFSEKGQATVEAAFVLPVLFVVFGLFLQPAFLLYDRCVMESAAAETCRLVATASADSGAIQAFVLRRLGAIPNAAAFHEGGKDGWEISWSGGGIGEPAQVTIVNRVMPLPLIGVVAGLSSHMEGGKIVQSVSASASSTPQWASGNTPQGLIGAWK